MLETDAGPVGVDVVCLEEDSARKLDTVDGPQGQQVIYNLDRLGLRSSKSPRLRCRLPRSCQNHGHGLGARVRHAVFVAGWDPPNSTSPSVRVIASKSRMSDLNWIPTIIRLETAVAHRLANELRADLDLPTSTPYESDDAETEAQVALAVAEHLPLSLHDVSHRFPPRRPAWSLTVFPAARRSWRFHSGLQGRLGTKTSDEDGAQLPDWEGNSQVRRNWPA